MIIALIVVLQIADIILTKLALDRGLSEVNPVARKLFGFMGVLPASIALKLVGMVPMVAFAAAYPAYWYFPAAYAFLLVALIGNNLNELRA